MLITGILAALSLILLLKASYKSGEIPSWKPKINSNDSEIKIKIGEKEYKGYIFLAEDLPNERENLGKRLLRVLKASNVSATLINGIYLVDKDRLIKDLDDRIKKLELIYEGSRLIKYKKALEVLKDIYEKVLLSYKPYVGGLAIVVWSDESAKVEALRSLLEVELGVSLRKLKTERIQDLLAPPAKIIQEEGKVPFIISKNNLDVYGGIVVGKNIEDDSLIILKWPQDFEKHVGIIGPTGRGKTVLLAGLTAQLKTLHIQRGDPASIVVIDPKGDLTRLVRDLADSVETLECIPKVSERSKLVESLLRFIDYKFNDDCKINLIENGVQVFNFSRMDDGLKDRGMLAVLLELINMHLQRDPKGRRVVIIDEAWRLRERGSKVLETIIREGRSRLLHLIYVIHDISDVENVILSNTSTLFVFGNSNETYIKNAEGLGFENAREVLPELMIGEALLRVLNKEMGSVKIFDFERMLNKIN